MKYLFLILLLPVMALAQLSATDSQYRNDGETLINGSFEQGKKGYTFAVGSGSPTWATQSTTSLTGKAMQLTLSAQTFNFKSATVQGSKLTNQYGLIEVYISASASGVEFCPLVDGTSEAVNSAQCQPVMSGVGFRPYSIQKVFQSSSLNYEIRNTSAGAFTGTVYIDDGSVAKKSGIFAFNLDNTYSAKVSSAGVVSGENIDWIDGNCTSTSPYTCTFKTGLFSVAPNCFIQFVGDTGDNTRKLSSLSTSVQYRTTDAVPATINAPVEIFCQKSGGDYTSASSSAFASANSNYDWTAYTPTFTGFPNASSIECHHSRDGGDLLLRCKFATGAGATATEARVSLPNNLLSALSTSIPSLQIAGWGGIQAVYGGGSYSIAHPLIEPNVGYITFGYSQTALGALTKINANTIPNTNVSFFARIPIQGWQNAPYIVGSFQGYNYTSGVNNVDTFSVSYGTTNATTNCTASPCSYLDQVGDRVVSITRTGGTGNYSLNLAKTYLKLKCQANITASGVGEGSVRPLRCESCSALAFTTLSTAGASADSYGTLFCQGSY
jgi:hypothetical protein